MRLIARVTTELLNFKNVALEILSCIYYTSIDFNEADIRIYQPEKCVPEKIEKKKHNKIYFTIFHLKAEK